MEHLQSYQPEVKVYPTISHEQGGFIPSIGVNEVQHLSAPFTFRVTARQTLSFLSYYQHTEIALPKLVEEAQNRLPEDLLFVFGKHMAMVLANVLSQLGAVNKMAQVNEIVSVFEPFTEREKPLEAKMPPKSSKEVTIKVEKIGKVLPKGSLD